MSLTKKITLYTLSYSPTLLTLSLLLMTFLLYLKIGYVPYAETDIINKGLGSWIHIASIVNILLIFAHFLPFFCCIACVISDDIDDKVRYTVLLGLISIIILDIFIKYGGGISWLLWYD